MTTMTLARLNDTTEDVTTRPPLVLGDAADFTSITDKVCSAVEMA